MSLDTIAIIGLGKVGTAMGYLLKESGHDIVAIYDTSNSALDNAVRMTGGIPFQDEVSAASSAKTIFITANDDSIENICSTISGTGAITAGKKVIHMSGAGGIDLLKSASKKGAHVASIHPIQSFADEEGAIENLPGSTFGIVADAEIRDWSFDLVRRIGGRPFLISNESKPLYHAAACIASNYLVTLIDTVVEIYGFLGLSQEQAIDAVWPLIQGTLSNIKRRGTVCSLTGPIARGDVGTVEKHVEAILKNIPHIHSFYTELGTMTTDLSLRKASISTESAEKIKSTLKGENK